MTVCDSLICYNQVKCAYCSRCEYCCRCDKWDLAKKLVDAKDLISILYDKLDHMEEYQYIDYNEFRKELEL